MVSKSLYLAVTFLSTLAPSLAIPIESADSNAATTFDNFYLVTTSSSEKYESSSELPDAQALSIFAPFHQADLWLRSIGPGYLSLNTFNSTNGALVTESSDGFGQGSYLYNSLPPSDGEEFTLVTTPETTPGSLSLKDDYLVTVDESNAEGWVLCTRSDNQYLGQEVLLWNVPSTDSSLSCTKVYVQAVSTPPY